MSHDYGTISVVERDVDLYRWTPSGEPGLETQVEWIVASSRSQAAEDE